MATIFICDICGSEKHAIAHYCKRCKKLIDRVDMRKRPDKKARIKALKDAWDDKDKCFRCYYSNIVLGESNHKEPNYLTFDHRTPRNESDIVIAAALINDMKSDLSDVEFRAIVIQLAKKFNGGTFDKKVFNLQYWKR